MSLEATEWAAGISTELARLATMHKRFSRAERARFRAAVELIEAFERAVRINVWNAYKSEGMSDSSAYVAIKQEVERIAASAMSASGQDPKGLEPEGPPARSGEAGDAQ